MVYVSLDFTIFDNAVPCKFGIKSYAEESMKIVGRVATRNGCDDIVLAFCIVATDFLLLWRNDSKTFWLGSVRGIRTPDGRPGDINVNVGRVDDIGSVKTDTKMGSTGGWKT